MTEISQAQFFIVNPMIINTATKINLLQINVINQAYMLVIHK